MFCFIDLGLWGLQTEAICAGVMKLLTSHGKWETCKNGDDNPRIHAKVKIQHKKKLFIVIKFCQNFSSFIVHRELKESIIKYPLKELCRDKTKAQWLFEYGCESMVYLIWSVKMETL